jgi:hypothetical protein
MATCMLLPLRARDGPLARQDWLRTRFAGGANKSGGVPEECEAERHRDARRGCLPNGEAGGVGGKRVAEGG